MGLRLTKLLTAMALIASIRQPLIFFASSVVLALIPSAAYSDDQMVIGEVRFPSERQGYIKRISQIKPGTTLIFTGETGKKSYRVGALLGHGSTTSVYELLDHHDKVLRLPMLDWHTLQSNISWINATITGSIEIQKSGIPSVKVHDYKMERYVVVDRVDGLTLDEYVAKYDEFSNEERAKIEEDLVKFGIKTSVYAEIGDFRVDQMMYDKKKGWLLTDWNSILTKRGTSMATTFDHLSEIYFEDMDPSDEERARMDKILKKVIQEIRLHRDSVSAPQCSGLF